jgi:N-acetylmuramic acid 6-phosphate (MurNAc-6-P) etherase
VEDKPAIGLLKLKEKLNDATMPVEFILIGITCGLSAPFVGGQLDYCLNGAESAAQMVACGVIGFNPIETSRQTVKINEHGETFLDLMLKMKKNEETQTDKFFILNPYIGPEPVTGSTRMKSGTCTKIMLDLILTNTLNGSFDCRALIGFYERLVDEAVYSVENQIRLGEVVNKAGKALARNESVNYLCDSVRLGLLCCVDASECVPTFGAKRGDFKGFVNSHNGKDASFDGFLAACSTTWSTNIQLGKFNSDLFVLVDDDDDDDDDNVQHGNSTNKNSLEAKLKNETKCTLAHLDVSFESKPSKQGSILNQAAHEVNKYFAKCLQEFYLKLSINAISTGAHVLIGKTYSNIMIDVRVSNIKLYYRAISILARLSNEQKDRLECEQSLLRSIYLTDNRVDLERGDNSLDKVIELATAREFVVPKALIMLLSGCDVRTASKMIDETRRTASTSIRDCIHQLINNKH